MFIESYTCTGVPVEGLYCKRPIKCHGVFRNIDPPAPPHRPASVYPPKGGGEGGGHIRWVERGWEDTLARGRGGGGSIVQKTPDTALYSTYVSTIEGYCLLRE